MGPNLEPIEKLKQYKGGLVLNLKYPTERKHWVTGAKRILQFYFRVVNKQLWWRPMLTNLIKLADLWLQIGETKYKELELEKFKWTEEFMYELKEVVKGFVLKVLDDRAEMMLEESREKGRTKCSICATVLVNPAYIVTRKAKEIVHKSQPIGIICLHHQQEKMEKLIKDILITFNGTVEVRTQVGLKVEEA
jgi:hypothetical protein